MKARVKATGEIWTFSQIDEITFKSAINGHGTKAFDAESWDNHENDARRWNLYLLHHMETSWQDDGKEAEILKFYESLPRVGIFEKKDYDHFIRKH